MIGFPVFVVIKFQFKAVTPAAQGTNGAQGGIPLGPDAYIPVALPVDYHRADAVLLTFTGFDKAVPVVHHNVYGMYGGSVEQPLFIAHGAAGGYNPPGSATHKQKSQHK